MLEDPRLHRARAGAATPARVILLEFNELCPALIARWMAEGHLPNFARLHAMSEVFTTEADVSDAALLEPWIQWYSAHTGLAYDQHRVFHLTDGPRAGHADIYRVLLQAGLAVGSMASMNVAPFASAGSFFVGDPWSEAGDAFPPELDRYNRFVSGQVREYSNASAATGLATQVGFLRFMLGNGLGLGTVGAILRQLAAERIRDRRLAYRRVAILDRLQFDLFRHLYARDRPAFASFFLNSTAHLQHSYFRHLDPDAFAVKPDPAEMAIYGDAVRFGYEAMDRLLGRFLALAKRHDAMPVFMTGLSQQPFTRFEDRGGQHFHRLHDVEALLDRLGVARVSVDPTMTHQYMLRFADAAARAAGRARLEALRLDDGRALLDFAERPGEADADRLYFGCQITERIDLTTGVTDTVTGERWRFGDLLYRIDAIKSGRHHPEGALWFGAGRGRVHAAPVSILDLFPTLVELFGAAPPADPPRRGRSLMPLMRHPLTTGR